VTGSATVATVATVFCRLVPKTDRQAQLADKIGSHIRRLTNDRHSAWAWSDGTPAPQVSDLSASQHFNFRCSSGHVEVPIATAYHEPELRWVWSGQCAGIYRESLSGDHTGPKQFVLDPEGIKVKATRADGGKRAIPRVALVPIDVWDRWAAQNPIGATWPTEAEEDIMSKARSLGWQAG